MSDDFVTALLRALMYVGLALTSGAIVVLLVIRQSADGEQ